MHSALELTTEHSPLAPLAFRVAARRQEAPDVVTLGLEPTEPGAYSHRAGQFNMLTAFGVGEVAVSISSAPGDAATVEHTVRDVGAVTSALCRAPVGTLVGVRGPFGTDWRTADLRHRDVVVVAGGIGLAPLRGAVWELMATHAADARRRVVLVGARSPNQVIFGEDIEAWRSAGAEVEVTVDIADRGWQSHVGVVTTLISSQRWDNDGAVALVCGPEVMMRFAARALLDTGLGPERIRVSLERNMQCGVGWCGHCQLGGLLLCRDGPVVSYGAVAGLLSGREL
jgi:NAD(P)H-flavin reductase